MIELPLFNDEEWYLQQVKKCIVDNRIKDKNKITTQYNEKINKIISTLEEIICDDDFSCDNSRYNLFEKLILSPFKDLKHIQQKIFANIDAIFYNVEIDFEGNEKRNLKEKWKTIYGLYDKLISKGINTELVKKYELSSCPYCNENYIFNRKKAEGKTYAMAQLDHFYPRDKFPIFAVSLYNLVPSCSACNHMKSTKEIGVCPHDHSYDFSNMKISYIPCTGNWIENSDDIKLNFTYKNEDCKAEMELNLEILGIKSTYSMHTDYVQELLKKAQIYGPDMRNSLMTQFPDLFASEEELLRTIFGNYIEIKDTLKRPLSKLTKDLLIELGIIT